MMDATETMNPETAVVGMTYWNHAEAGTSSNLVWADWVNRKTSALAGATRDGMWGQRIDLINKKLSLGDFDKIADETGGERQESQDFAGRGGKLTLAGVMAAVALAAERAGQPKRIFAGPAEFECLECGAVYSDPSKIEPGGMGCIRCS